MSRCRRALPLLAALAAVALLACEGDDADDDATVPASAAAEPTEAAPSTAASLPAPDPGSGAVSLGGSVARFEVVTCRPEGNPNEPEGARTLFLMEGRGTTASGVAFTVTVQRFRSGIGTQTFTDTITYEDGARILQAQRIEVNGVITDLRDPEAGSPLLRVRSDGVSAQGIAGPPGSTEGGEGLVAISLEATCR